MWSKLVLLCLVGLAIASNDSWKNGNEYIYRIRGRTLTGLHDVDDQYSGIVVKADLHIQPQASDNHLYAKIKNGQYAQIHAQLPGGWDSHIPDSKLNYQQMQFTQEAFKIKMENGVVQDLIVSKQVPNWEANIIKSIVSQFQLDTLGQNAVRSSINQLPQENSYDAVYKTMEDTVTGKYQTLYDIQPLPEVALQYEPHLVPYPEMKGDGEIIEIVKSKNFSDAHELAGYHYGLGGIGKSEPSSAHMGDFFLRSSVSRAIITGNLKRYTVQSSSTTNKIVVSPALNNAEKGMVVSHLNLTLLQITKPQQNFQAPQNPIELKSLVYRYDEPFSKSNEPRPSQFSANHERGESAYSSGSSSSSSSSEEDQQQQQQQQHKHQQNRKQRQLRDLRQQIGDYEQQGGASSSSSSSSSQSYSSASSEEYWQQEEAKFDQPPHTPLLPFYIGYKGSSIKYSPGFNVVQAVQKIAQQIGQELQQPQQMIKEQTTSKYNILASLTRIMSQQEMQEVARQLYSNEQKGAKIVAWKAYRDAIAECGTSPALLVVEEWIQSKKIRNEEAAEIIAAVAASVRQPTDKYMRTFYTLVTKQEYKDMKYFNDTAMLVFSDLARKVYIDKYASHNQYPVHAFGSFRSKQGYKMIDEEWIPYLTEQLNKAVSNGQSHKILVHIRALGNVAHKKILRAFEPYLEGEKQASQFQRLQMVLALDKFVKVDPKTARSVLYKVYQNAGEAEEVRAAAVYQLMRTGPSSSMLQRMAEYTNVDTSEQVNAAVKSSIESASQLEGGAFHNLRTNARAARPLLTPKEYGAHYSKNHLTSYVVKEMDLYYKHTLQTTGSDDSWVPRYLKAALRVHVGGLRQQTYNAQYAVSSVEELVNVFQQQTEGHHKEHQQQQQHGGEAQQNQFSAESIARLLNIKTEEREQLEGSLWVQLGQTQRLFAFNNQTINELPEILRDIENDLRAGKDFQYSKFINGKDIAVSFPTEMGMPFIYTFDVPTVFYAKGHAKATAEPAISNGKRISKPKAIKAQAEIDAVFSSKLETQIGFITPFDHQQYCSGYDKNLHFHVPLKMNIKIDTQNQQAQLQIQPAKPEQDERVFDYYTYPYTAKHDILSLQPIANRPNTQIIDTKPKVGFESVFGKETGFSLRVKYHGQRYYMDNQWIADRLRRNDLVSAFMEPIYEESIQPVHFSLDYLGSQSQNPKVNLYASYDKTENKGVAEQEFDPKKLEQLPEQPEEYLTRRNQMVQMVSNSIKGSHSVRYAEVLVQFEGQQKAQYYATTALAKSNVHPKSLWVVYYKKTGTQGKPFKLAFVSKTHMPNTNGLDFTYALQFDPTTTSKAQVYYGESLQSPSKLNIHAELRKSNERKLYLQNLPEAHQCQQEMQKGNHQLPACANLTASANLLDQITVHVDYENIGPKARNLTNKLYNALEYLGYFHLDENRVDANGKPNQLQLEAHFNPDFEAVNVSIQAEKLRARFQNVHLNEYAQRIFAIHPVFRASARVGGKLLAEDAYRPYCVVDHTACNTFDNRTYPVELPQDWTVMMHYAPRTARYQQQNRQQRGQDQLQTPEEREQIQNEQYVVLVRQSKVGQQQKDVRMYVRTPESKGQIVEIELYPAKQSSPSGSRPAAKVIVNKNEQQINDKDSVRVNGDIEIYTLPNGEVKVEVLNRYYMIYDGQRAKLTTVNCLFRDAVRGLCGTFTGNEATDFRTPENCIAKDPKYFVESYVVPEHGQQRSARHEGSQQYKCLNDRIQYANVISERDSGLENREHSQNKGHGSQCTKHQVRYVVDEASNQICFSIRPYPRCMSPCTPKSETTKIVQMYCLQKSSVTEHWQKRIDEGASPDFGSKQYNKEIQLQIPRGCSM